MKTTSHRPPGGFTLIEAMIALVVLLVALVGALAGLISASNEFRSGQVRQAEMVLIEAKSQRMMLMDHANGPVGWPAPDLQWSSAPATSTWGFNAGPETFPVGALPWYPDPELPVCPTCSAAGGTNGPLDLSVGAYFLITADGTITPDTTVAPGTPCNAIPVGTFCREIVIGQGIETTDPGGNLSAQALPLNHTGYTIWIRISRPVDPNAGQGLGPALTVVSRDAWVN